MQKGKANEVIYALLILRYIFKTVLLQKEPNFIV